MATNLPSPRVMFPEPPPPIRTLDQTTFDYLQRLKRALEELANVVFSNDRCLCDAIDEETYTAPSISLSSSPSSGIREAGNTSVTSVLLTATTVKHSDDITGVTYFRSAVLIHTEASPNPAGAAETYNETTAVTATTTFNAKVTDGTTLVTSNTLTFTFLYPFYYGVGAPALTAAQVGALTKIIEAQGDKTTTTSPSTQVYYFAYPAAYGALTSIKDTNGFETISDYTVRIENITGLDTTAQSYRIYEFNNLTTQTNFNNTYEF